MCRFGEASGDGILSGVTCISTPSAACLRSRGAAAALFTKTRTGSRFRAPQSESRSEGDERSAVIRSSRDEGQRARNARAKAEARAAAIEAGELQVEDPREKRERELKESQKPKGGRRGRGAAAS